MNNENDKNVKRQNEQDDLKSHDLTFIGSLMPGILHNLATPLSGVIGATQLMEMRNADQDELLERLESANEQAAGELNALFAKNKTNLEIIGRNANQLIELVQVMVQRFQRSSVRQKTPQSLNELLTNELAFLTANLAFKHKVRREVQMADEPYALSMVYAHVVSVIDEFVTRVVELHDTKQGMADMSFATSFESDKGSLTMKAEYQPFEDNPGKIEVIQFALDRIKEDGCDYSLQKDEPGSVQLRVDVPK